eukprot:g5683.t1 g5683   contig2:1056635-1058879(-)
MSWQSSGEGENDSQGNASPWNPGGGTRTPGGGGYRSTLTQVSGFVSAAATSSSMASSSDAENRLDPNAQQFRPPGQPPPSQSVPSQQQQQQQGRGEDHGNTTAAVRSGTQSPHLQSRLAGYQHHHQRNTTLPQSYPPPFQRQQHLSFQYSPQFQPIPSFVQQVDEQTHVSWGSQWSASVSQNVSVSSQRSSPQQESLPQTHLQRWSSLSPPPIAMLNVSSRQQQVFRPDVSAAPRPSQQQPEPQAFLPTSITSLSLEPGASSRGRGFLPFNPYHHPGHSAFAYSGLMSGGSGQERSPTTHSLSLQQSCDTSQASSSIQSPTFPQQSSSYSTTSRDDELKSPLPQNLRGDPFRSAKVKTELCRYFNSAKGCIFGDKCNYAHGEQELKFNKLMDLEVAGLVDVEVFGRILVLLGWLRVLVPSIKGAQDCMILVSMDYNHHGSLTPRYWSTMSGGDCMLTRCTTSSSVPCTVAPRYMALLLESDG